jgi:hypothetical protein
MEEKASAPFCGVRLVNSILNVNLFQSYQTHYLNDIIPQNYNDCVAHMELILRMLQRLPGNMTEEEREKFDSILHPTDILNMGLFIEDRLQQLTEADGII